jgi:hypothetical protein
MPAPPRATLLALAALLLATAGAGAASPQASRKLMAEGAAAPAATAPAGNTTAPATAIVGRPASNTTAKAMNVDLSGPRPGREPAGPKPPFPWGIATSAFQSEGASKQDGRGPSIWDEYIEGEGGVRARARVGGEEKKDRGHAHALAAASCSHDALPEGGRPRPRPPRKPTCDAIFRC